MTTEEVFAKVQHLSGNKPILVTLSGGNPAIQPLGKLIDLGHTHGYTFAIETQGSVAQPWFAHLDYLTLSPKPPSSKQVTTGTVSIAVLPMQPVTRTYKKIIAEYISKSLFSTKKILLTLDMLQSAIQAFLCTYK